MKLRRNEIISPKSFSTPRWRIKNPYRGIFDFLRKACSELLFYDPLAQSQRASAPVRAAK